MQKYILEIGVSLLVIFISLPIHEFAHAWSAYKLGDDTARLQGRTSLNPLVHIDPIGALCLLITQRFGWAKPVPVNPVNFRGFYIGKKYIKVSMKTGMVISAAAGPISNLIMALIATAIMQIILAVGIGTNTIFIESGGVYYAWLIMRILAIINVSLAVFNLIPIPPLDGSKVIGVFMSERAYYNYTSTNPMIMFILLIILIQLDFVKEIFTKIDSSVLEFMSLITRWIYDIVLKIVQ